MLDANDPAHAPSAGVQGLFGHDGTPPLELRRTASEQLRPYESVTVRMVAADEVRKTATGFDVLADREESSAGVLLLSKPGFVMSCRRSKAQRKSGPEAYFIARTVMAGRYRTGLWLRTESTPPDSRCC